MNIKLEKHVVDLLEAKAQRENRLPEDLANDLLYVVLANEPSGGQQGQEITYGK